MRFSLSYSLLTTWMEAVPLPANQGCYHCCTDLPRTVVMNEIVQIYARWRVTEPQLNYVFMVTFPENHRSVLLPWRAWNSLVKLSKCRVWNPPPLYNGIVLILISLKQTISFWIWCVVQVWLEKEIFVNNVVLGNSFAIHHIWKPNSEARECFVYKTICFRCWINFQRNVF